MNIQTQISSTTFSTAVTTAHFVFVIKIMVIERGVNLWSLSAVIDPTEIKYLGLPPVS